MLPGDSPPTTRRIIHIDMDAFYASVEQRDDPDLRGRAVAVGRGEGRGVVAAASYEARRFGVRSAMPSRTALRHCPDLVFVPPRFDVYRAVSRQIHAVFARYTALIQPLSLDEASLDVSGTYRDYGSATQVARLIRAAIFEETGLTASAGISYNRFLAKLASDHRKPNGQFVITPQMGPGFAAALRVEQFHGIGPATRARMNALGIFTGADLRDAPIDVLKRHFGKAAAFYAAIARGIDDRPVVADTVRKSLGTETTFERDLSDWNEARNVLEDLCAKLWRLRTARAISGRTLVLKIKYADFRSVTRTRSESRAIATEEMMRDQALVLLRMFFPLDRPIRLMGVTLTGLEGNSGENLAQMTLFDDSTC
ncbi:DNA polymerase IV [Swaminathania salitolerans]|uniref:DNA polymerase IV n=1 Tax=Swaminathania salitolerans TaxID=182838 RepID=A0A511BQ80_9PROT|nr:DNA polymerase IV [Swaminathania salitolerans]GBQ11316.1 DNA polymerase IV [Swaminathania salitolerans LMG 21291]GEL02425.1 DNA polymerase IV [Swaminathania salitolerans]